MKLQYLILFLCFVGVLHNCYADDDTSSSKNGLSHPIKYLNKKLQIKGNVIPNCYFGVKTIAAILFTRENEDGLILTTQNLTKSEVFKKDQIKRPIIILIHGFVSSANNSNYEVLVGVLLKKVNAVIISIDWKDGACNGGLSILEIAGYFQAVLNTRVVGEYIATNYIKILVETYGVALSNIKIIAHSLGAHIAGFVGKHVIEMYSKKISQITALDPAGPLFTEKKPSERLCSEDADFVQVLHTSYAFGTVKRLGNVDFYVNSGRLQPSCSPLDPTCSHSRAVQYLTECIRYKCCLVGIPWEYHTKKIPLSNCTKETCVCIGLNIENYPNQGSFYVPVDKKAPYCYNEGLKL